VIFSRHATDKLIVIDGTWTFTKADASLTLERRPGQGDDVILVVGEPKGGREIAFATVEALSRFQEDMETFLLRTGWTLASFSPERRALADRRTFPRITNDRRRWWTDPIKS
jgi:hypothetical protein